MEIIHLVKPCLAKSFPMGEIPFFIIFAVKAEDDSREKIPCFKKIDLYYRSKDVKDARNGKRKLIVFYYAIGPFNL